MRLLDKIFGKKEPEGSPCWVLGKEANIIDIVPGIIGTNLDDGIEISYTWVDNTKHKYLESQYNYIGVRGRTGLPVYTHDVGQLFGEGLTKEMVDAFNESLIKDGKQPLPCIGSEYYQSISASNIGSQMITTLEEFQEGSNIPWKIILIAGGVIIVAVVLWQTGIVQSLLGSVSQSVVPATGIEPGVGQ